jgi:hypothetical protein
MSYEGSREFLCKVGHYFGCDAYDSDPKKCPICGESIAYVHSIDQTNGEIKDQPSTRPARKRTVKKDDLWHVDHHGNKYATQVARYRPVGTEWLKV